MCTVSLIARRSGYALAMNRDEKLTRVTGCPPTRQVEAGCAVVSPAEPGGGTWIALNDSGVTLALINWYAVTARVRGHSVSRGGVIRAAQTAETASQVDLALRGLPLRRINPFRLIGIFPGAREIWEWRWDSKKLAGRKHPWRTVQWISSGWDEPAAQRIRGKTFRRAQSQKTAGTVDWLRRLHRSHTPAPGATAICMHRADAATVSYTEVVVTANRAVLGYHPSALCRQARGRRYRLQLRTPAGV
jgi:hypothetical protein